MPKKNTFFRNDMEIVWRSLWFARNITDQIGDMLYWESGLFIIEHRLEPEKEKQRFKETIAYTTSIVLEEIADDIMKLHGWNDQELDLHLTYKVALAEAFDAVVGCEKEGKHVFLELLNDYLKPDYNEEYDYFWGIPKDEEPETVEEAYQQLHEAINEDMGKIAEKYNNDRLYAFRVNKIYNIPNPQKFVDMWKPRCSSIAIPAYRKAFFGLGLRRLKKDLKRNHVL